GRHTSFSRDSSSDVCSSDLAAHAPSAFNSVADVIAAAKAEPGSISVGSPGQGTVNEVVIEWVALNTGTKLQHVPYKGSAPAANADRKTSCRERVEMSRDGGY